jgi:hypothetical protein
MFLLAMPRHGIFRRLAISCMVLCTTGLTGSCSNDEFVMGDQYYRARPFLSVTASVTSERFTIHDTVTVTITVNNDSEFDITVPDQICGAPFELTFRGAPTNPNYVCDGEKVEGGVAPAKGKFVFVADVSSLLKATVLPKPGLYGVRGRVRLASDTWLTRTLGVELVEP